MRSWRDTPEGRSQDEPFFSCINAEEEYSVHNSFIQQCDVQMELAHYNAIIN